MTDEDYAVTRAEERARIVRARRDLTEPAPPEAGEVADGNNITVIEVY